MTSEISVRKMLASDLSEVDKLAEECNFEIGLHNLQILYDTSPHSWYVAINVQNEIIAFTGGNDIEPNMMGYAYIIMVSEKYRGKGVSRLFYGNGLPELLTYPKLLGSNTAYSIVRYQSWIGECWLDKKLSFFGTISKLPPKPEIQESFVIKPLTPNIFDSVAEYDGNLLKLNRGDFIRKWSMDSYAKTFVAIDSDGQCLGYGTLRLFTSYFAITPMYAESEEVAKSIFDHLTSKLKVTNTIWVPFLAKQKVIFDRCGKLGLKLMPNDVDIRHCSVKAKEYAMKLDTNKVYCPNEFWPL